MLNKFFASGYVCGEPQHRVMANGSRTLSFSVDVDERSEPFPVTAFNDRADAMRDKLYDGAFCEVYGHVQTRVPAAGRVEAVLVADYADVPDEALGLPGIDEAREKLEEALAAIGGGSSR